MEVIREWIELAILVIKLFAALIITVGFLRALARYGVVWHEADRDAAFTAFRTQLGMELLLGLEVLVVADVIESITIEPSAQALGVLAFLVAVRTMLSWSTFLQVEGRWPWQPEEVRTRTDG